jgi:hypothetical protein
MDLKKIKKTKIIFKGYAKDHTSILYKLYM